MFAQTTCCVARSWTVFPYAKDAKGRKGRKGNQKLVNAAANAHAPKKIIVDVNAGRKRRNVGAAVNAAAPKKITAAVSGGNA